MCINPNFKKFCILQSLYTSLFYQEMLRVSTKLVLFKCFDHHSHRSTTMQKSGIFNIRTNKQFILGEISREYLLQILLKIDQVAKVTLGFVSSTLDYFWGQTLKKKNPWVTCSSFCWYSWYFFPYFNQILCLFYVSSPTVIFGSIFFVPSSHHCTYGT